MEKYQDIINTQWPQKSQRPRMSLEQRAKIFLPFSALRGYEESLDNERRVTVQKSRLSDESKKQINQSLKKIFELLEEKKSNQISLTYFLQDKDSDEGVYEEIFGTVKKIDMENQQLIINQTKIFFDDIYEIKIDK